MLILSPGSIRGCRNAKVVKAVVVMVTALHRRGALGKVLGGRGGLLGADLCRAGEGSVIRPGGQETL